MLDIRQSYIDQETGAFDEEAFNDFTEELLVEFADSPEGQFVIGTYGELGWAGTMMGYAANYPGVLLTDMTTADFREVVFELFPRKVSVEPEKAAEIITELRAFWQYLQRSYKLPNAKSILAELDNSAAARLQRELANPAKFGMAKSFFSIGANLGFDMTTQAGLDTFLLYYNSKMANGGGVNPIPFAMDEFDDDDFDDEPIVPTTTPKERAEVRKKKRKAERQARKRNRRKG